jgi:hypothetical protein
MTEKSDFHEHLEGWFAGRLPAEWFVGPIDVSFDRDEILVVGTLAEPELPRDAGPETRTAAAEARISGFREDTRTQRMRIADEAERRFGRKISWGAKCADQRQLFTTLAIPAMTRLRMPEREVLDTLVDAGVARSRADALAWSVRLVGEHTEEWLAKLRDAMSAVDDLRAEGPDLQGSV